MDVGIGAAEQLVARLRGALSHDRVRTDDAERGLYERDASLIAGTRPTAVVLPLDTAEVQACVRAAADHDHAVVARGSGTGLAGGAVPVGRSIVVATTLMNRILSVDPVERTAWVEPGVINLDLSRAVAAHGLYYAPDPSSQQVCSIGGNVATNSGGPHCLLYGVTSAHVLAVDVVLADGTLATLGGLEAEPDGYDLRGAFVGSEGTLGIATRIAVRLEKTPPAVETMLVDFVTVGDAAACVSAIIAAGVIPAAMELMDQPITRAAEEFVHAGYPTDAAAILLVEVDGCPGGVAEETEMVRRIALDHAARTVRVAADDDERALLWKGRKSAFGAVARVRPNYYLHDTVVPRSKLVEVLDQIYAIADRHELIVMNVFHAGDGNLHPLLVFDAREPGVMDRVHAAGEEIVDVSLAAGGVLSGEHGIGLEKQRFMDRQFSPDDLDAQARMAAAFDPADRMNPAKVLPSGSRCGELAGLPEGAWI